MECTAVLFSCILLEMCHIFMLLQGRWLRGYGFAQRRRRRHTLHAVGAITPMPVALNGERGREASVRLSLCFCSNDPGHSVEPEK